MSFINAGLAGFLALASIPLIIYLINRQRYQRVSWAAMEFLLRAMHKNRRRLRLENLLLLIIRTLIVLLFVLAMMRPFLESSVLTQLGGRSRAEIIVIDRSYSMGLREGHRPLLIEAVERAKQLINELGKGDRVGLFLAGGNTDVVFSEPHYLTDDITGGSGLLLDELEDIEVGYRTLDLAFTLQEVARWVREKGGEGGWTVHFFTDLQRKDWLGPDGETDPAIGDALRRLEEMEVPVLVQVVGGDKPRNAGIESLECRDRILATDLSTAFDVTVANHSREEMAGLEVELWVNDEVQGSKRISIDAGGSETVSFPYIFRRSGEARVKAVLLSDALEEDNFHYLVAEVRDSVNVVILDGGYSDLEDSDEAAWLGAALDLGTAAVTGVRLTPYVPRIIGADRIGSVDLEQVDIVVLADVAALPPSDHDALEKFVDGGGGVLAFVGERADLANYRTHGFRGGEGWFPYSPKRTYYDAQRQEVFRWRIVRPGHPTMQYLAETEEAGMDRVAINGFVEPTAVPESSILIELDNGVPMLVERGFGKGIALVMNMGADRHWSNFPISPAYLCFLHEGLPYLVAQSDVVRNLGIEEPFSRVVPSQEFSTEVLLISSAGDGVRLALEQRPDGNTFQLLTRGQERPGNYEIRFGGTSADESVRSEWFSVNADPEEGILTRIYPDEVKDAYPGKYLRVQDEASAGPAATSLPAQRSGEVWRTLMWGVLALLALESLLARYFGGRRART